MKVGTPTNAELEELALAISEKWIALGRRLGLEDPVLEATDRLHHELSEKAYNMLRRWKLERGSAATYQVLNSALGDPFIRRPDLAEKFFSDWVSLVVLL